MVWTSPPSRIRSSRKTLMKPEMVQFFKTFGWRTENSPSFLRLTRYQRNFEPYPTITQVMRNWGTTISFPLRSNNVKLSLWEFCSIALYCTNLSTTTYIKPATIGRFGVCKDQCLVSRSRHSLPVRDDSLGETLREQERQQLSFRWNTHILIGHCSS